jgi:cell wall-associated NlpC family hydrolase
LSFSCVVFADDIVTGDYESKADITDRYEGAAEELYMYGLFKGGSNGFDLGSESTKVQAAVMVVRLIGAESEVLKTSFKHPYSDVPAWASNYVGYLYQNGINIADSSTVFGSNKKISLREFLVLVIESLGYEDVNVSSTTEAVFACAVDTGLLVEDEVKELKNTEFDRGTMAYVARQALDTTVADSETTLYDSLNSKGIIQSLPAPDSATKYGSAKEVLSPAVEAAKPSLGETIVAKAKANLGIKYRSGGKSPSTGFDCSGFVGYVMVQSGVWSSQPGNCDGIASKCTKISMSEAKAGDIVFFKGTYKTSNTYSHVGIYLGNGQMIHCASSKGVSISSITSGYWAKHYSCIARPTVLM